MTPRVLALDASLTSTGVCFPDGTLDTLCPPKGLRDGARLAWLDDTFRVLIAEHRPTVVVVEAPLAHGAHARGSLNLHKLYGVLEANVHRAGIPLVYIPATTLKKAATGNGHAKKEQMFRAACDADFGCANYDEADAALLWHGWHQGWFQ